MHFFTTYCFIALFSLLSICSTLDAQMKTEIGGMIGTSYYLGDLNPTKQFPSGHNHFSWGILIRQPINERWAWKSNFIRTQLSGSDASNNTAQSIQRNLSFTTNLTEVSTQFEFNFFRYHSFVIRHHISPYMFGGFGLAWIDPRTTLNGNEYNLRQYITEDKKAITKRTQFVIPFGMGIKFKMSHRIMFSVEFGLRKTFTDYLDDVSTAYPEDPQDLTTISQALSNKSEDTESRNIWGTQRGNPSKKDLYTNTNISVLLRIGKSPNLCKYNTQ